MINLQGCIIHISNWKRYHSSQLARRLSVQASHQQQTSNTYRYRDKINLDNKHLGSIKKLDTQLHHSGLTGHAN
jgi:hypothetical protein